MIFTPARIPEVWVVDPEPHEDIRGTFVRTWCRREFAAHGLPSDLVQCSASRTYRKGTIRGLHWQAPPHWEDKVVRCVRGTVWDVAVDLRPDSPTYLEYVGVELSEENGRAMVIPKGFAHGFQTLTDHTEVHYQMSTFYEPASARGARWNDPAFGIAWPLPDPILHPRDATYPDFDGVD